MVILKRIKSSTLMETLVATVLIVVIFMIASMILNNVFSNSINNSTQAIENRLRELQYLSIHEKIELPYQEKFQNWNISISNFKQNPKEFIDFEAINSITNKSLIKIDYGK